MRKLIAPMLLIVPMLALSACHPESVRVHHDDGPKNYVPSGGLDWGTFNHFEHDFATRDISSSSDQDGFEFFLAESSVVVITTTASGGFDPFLDLYEDNFDFITGDDDGGPGNDAVLVGTLSAGGYFVVVGGSGASTGTYDIDISVEPLGGADFGEMFPSDSFVDNGGVMDDAFDVDSYVFTVFSSVSADIVMTTTAGALDPNLELVDEYGTVILFNDPAGMADPDALGVSLTPGTYIVRIGTSSGSGDYSLQIDIN
ncbi:MAG: hypothetical protein H6839_13635 [Planctomycetes bacterium]|nr:hypothetical protein [Planctomycetota bacterium]